MKFFFEELVSMLGLSVWGMDDDVWAGSKLRCLRMLGYESPNLRPTMAAIPRCIEETIELILIHWNVMNFSQEELVRQYNHPVLSEWKQSVDEPASVKRKH